MTGIFRLTPSLHDNIWGGRKLLEYGKDSDLDRIGESWELSFVPGEEARIADGRITADAFPKECWGDNCRKFESFPVLTKFIDAKDKLSVQVHPDDEYALAYENQYGKSEMWYVVDADPGAGLYMGLERNCTVEEFSSAVADGTVEELLSFKEVRPGDVFFIPAGTIHAIGKGVLIYEIQQNSTLTYRLYDYMRRDSKGALRPLHVDKAMQVSRLSPYTPESYGEEPSVIGKCKYFITRKYDLKGSAPLYLNVGKESYLAVTAVSGNGKIRCGDITENLTRGDSFFIPAGTGEIEITGELTVITVATP
jgi:mannose-6-phosphate isomerase